MGPILVLLHEDKRGGDASSLELDFSSPRFIESIWIQHLIRYMYQNVFCQSYLPVPNPRKTGSWETLFNSVTEHATGTRLAFATRRWLRCRPMEFSCPESLPRGTSHPRTVPNRDRRLLWYRKHLCGRRLKKPL